MMWVLRAFQKTATGLALLLIFSMQQLPAAHPFHATMAEMDWNSASTCFEVALCMPAVVTEDEISREQARRINLERTDDAEELLQKYIAKRFQLHNADAQWNVEWVGAEVDGDSVWSYFELHPSKTKSVPIEARSADTAPKYALTLPTDLKLDCRLFSSRPGQVNLVTVRYGSRTCWLHFTETVATAAVDFSGPQQTTSPPILTD